MAPSTLCPYFSSMSSSSISPSKSNRKMGRRLRYFPAMLALCLLSVDVTASRYTTSLSQSLINYPEHSYNFESTKFRSRPPSLSSSIPQSTSIENSAFIFSLLKRRRNKRLMEEEQQKQQEQLDASIRFVPNNNANPQNGISITNGQGSNGHQTKASAILFNGRNGVKHSDQTIQPQTSISKPPILQDVMISLDSMEGNPNSLLSENSHELNKNGNMSKDSHTNGDYGSTENSIAEKYLIASKGTKNAKTATEKRIKFPKQDPEWAKRNARSIDEGIRFKSLLTQGLEEQTKLHRERLLSDLLQGVISGGSNALDMEGKGNSNGINPFTKWFSFGRGGNSKEDAAAAIATNSTGDYIRVDNVGNSTPKPINDADTKENDLADDTEKSSSSSNNNNKNSQSRFGARTIAGLLNALAEEADDLDVEVDVDPTSPFWNKKVNSISVYFSRLGFQQIRMGGLDQVFSELETSLAPSEKFAFASSLFRNSTKHATADEAFDRMDTDNSGALDAGELGEALKMAAILGGNKVGMRSKETVSELASRLIRLYDTNGDGVVDKEEYRVMVQDMASLKGARLRDELHQKSELEEDLSSGIGSDKKKGWRQMIGQSLSSVFGGKSDNTTSGRDEGVSLMNNSTFGENIIDVTENEVFWGSIDQGEGSIVLSDLRLDLRRLIYGSIPLAKRILPGGPLILKPFTATVTASFTREDILDSFLIDAGLRRLVARALGRRVRGVRDFLDGAVFYGRTWKLFEQNSPLVEVPKLVDVQFDNRNRLVITGRAKIKASPDAPSIENGFKLRTKIGTRENGRIIGLLEPEIAVFAEFPKELEDKIRTTIKDMFGYTIPHPKPLYTYIPLVSPWKKNNMDGFNLGEDNQIKCIEVQNGKLRFEMSAVLRPGRFLGNHYLAFTVPIKTLIMTVDRVKQGMRIARRNKRIADKAALELKRLTASEEFTGSSKGTYGELFAQSISGKASISQEGKYRIRRLEKELKASMQEDAIRSESNNGKSFIGRFVEGYTGAIREELDLEMNARLTSSISDFFGIQDGEEGEDGRKDLDLNQNI